MSRAWASAKVKRPNSPEVGIWPALMIGTTSDSAPSISSAKDAPESPSYPRVERCIDAMTAVLEVLEPAAQHRVDHGDDRARRMPVGSSRPLPDFVFELLRALLARGSFPQLEVVTEKVKTAGRGRVHQFRFLGVQHQPSGQIGRAHV